MPRRRRILALSALLAFVAGAGAAPLLADPAFADGVLQISSPATGSAFTWDAAPNGLHVTGTTSDLLTDVDIFDGATLLGSCTPDGVGAFDCGVEYPYPGPHTINAEQGGVLHDSISVTVVYPAMNTPLPGFTVNAVNGGAASFSGQVMLYSAGYEYGYVSVDLGGDIRTCQDQVDGFGGWTCSIGIAGIPDGSYPVEMFTTGGPATGVTTNGTLTIAPYVVPTPTITSPEPDSHLTTEGAVVIGGNYAFGDLRSAAGGFITVTVDGATSTAQPCVLEFYASTETSWSCEIFPELGMNSVTAVVTEGDLAGQVSPASAIYVVGLGTEGAPTLDTPADGLVVAPGSAVAFSGTGPVISLPVVELRDYPSGSDFFPWCYGPVIGATGTWTCSTPLNAGEYEVRVSTEDVNGVTWTSAPIRVSAISAPETSDEPAVNCTFTPGGVSLDVEPGAWVELYGPVTVGGAEPFEPEEPGHCNGNAGTPVAQLTSFGPQLPCEFPCSLTGLAPGIYDVYSGWTDGEGEGEGEGSSLRFDYFFTVPVAPSIDGVSRSGATITATGSSLPGHPIRVVDGTTSLCQTTADGGGNWNCSFAAAAATTSLRALQLDPASGGISPLSEASAVPAAPRTLPTLAKPAWTWSFSIDGTGPYHPGDTVSFSGSGVPPGSTIVAELHSTVRLLGTTTAGADGSFVFSATIPSDVEAGDHHFVLTATPVGETPVMLEQPVAIIELPLPPAVEDEVAESGVLSETGSGSGSGSGSADRSDPAAPSILTNSLATFGHIVDDPFVLVLSGGLALALLFLVAFPTEILNSTLSENTGRLGRGFFVIEDRIDRIKTWFLRVTRSRALASGILVLVLSLIYGFTDPAFGWDLVSLRLVLSLAIGMFVLTYVIGWVTGLVSRLIWGVHSQVEFQPAIALFAVVGVVIARLLEFSPGFFVGVVIGLELLQASQRVASRVALLQFSLVVVVAVGAWLGYSALVSGGVPTDFGGALLGDTLVALTAEGLTAAAIAILPLRFLEGRSLFQHSKALWLVAFFIIEFAFALLVLPTAIEGTEVGDVGVWVIVFACFAVVTFALWGIFARLERRREQAEERNTAQHYKVRG